MDRTFPTLSPEEAAIFLMEAAVDVVPSEVAVERRDDRWKVALPGHRMAWFPANPEGAERLAIDRKLLRLLEARCRFEAPRIICEFGPGCDVRAMVPGVADPFPLFDRLKRDAAFARRMGRSLGLILAEQHTRIHREDVTPWLRTRVSWPEPGDWIREQLPKVVDDAPLIGEIDAVLRSYEAARPPASHLALVHGDLGVHNISVDPETNDLVGVFDYDGAAWDDRHHDFRLLSVRPRRGDHARRCDRRL